VSVATNHTFEGSEKVKESLVNPEAPALAVAPAAAPAEEEDEDGSR